MIVFYLVVVLISSDGTAVPVIKARTLVAEECSTSAQYLQARGIDAFCAIEQLERPVSNL